MDPERLALRMVPAREEPDVPTPSDIDAAVERILSSARRIAVVGLSASPSRTSHGVTSVMRSRGYEIVPVNPTIESWEGIPAVASLADIDGPVDLVNVFRREEHLAGVAAEAAAIGAPAVWNQLRLRSAEAAALAADAGMDYVEDRCIKVEAMRRDARPPADEPLA